jgi:hypothetical protein
MASKMNPEMLAMLAKKKAGARPAARPAARPMMPMMPMKVGGATKKMSSGGTASTRADGVAQQGKTKGMMLKKGGMARGGKAC